MARDIRDHAPRSPIFSELFPPFATPRILATMPPVLLPTNMTIDEMIPDHTNPGHDPRFWCLPPVRDKPNGTPGNYPMYLVSQGRQVGVWHNW
jgi:hypothetical protein